MVALLSDFPDNSDNQGSHSNHCSLVIPHPASSCIVPVTVVRLEPKFQCSTRTGDRSLIRVTGHELTAVTEGSLVRPANHNHAVCTENSYFIADSLTLL
jgi:hypothetical protein